MSVNTPRLQLVKPISSELMALGDIVIAHNYQILDRYIGAPAFTSGTRPGSPYTGQLIYETDTTNYRMYNGTKWIYMGNATNAWGLAATEFNNNFSGFALSGEKKWRDLTFTATQNRKYLIQGSFSGGHSTGSQGSAAVRFRWAAGSTVGISDALIEEDFFRINDVGQSTRQFRFCINFDYTAITQSITVGVFIDEQSGFSQISFGAAEFGVELGLNWAISDWGHV